MCYRRGECGDRVDPVADIPGLDREVFTKCLLNYCRYADICMYTYIYTYVYIASDAGTTYLYTLVYVYRTYVYLKH